MRKRGRVGEPSARVAARRGRGKTVEVAGLWPAGETSFSAWWAWAHPACSAVWWAVPTTGGANGAVRLPRGSDGFSAGYFSQWWSCAACGWGSQPGAAGPQPATQPKLGHTLQLSLAAGPHLAAAPRGVPHHATQPHGRAASARVPVSAPIFRRTASVRPARCLAARGLSGERAAAPFAGARGETVE